MRTLRFFYRLILPFVDLRRAAHSLVNFPRVLLDLIRYRRASRAEPIRITDLYLVAHEMTPAQSFDAHYFYQDVWAFDNITKSSPPYHVDVGSRVDFVGFLSTATRTVYVDIREFQPTLPNFEYRRGSILSLPFADETAPSLSCLHVAEHIGLGRYGDSLDPRGTQKGCAELLRILARGGHLYFSVPVGHPRVCFNAHRIFSPLAILGLFSELRLEEFAVVDDKKRFHRNADPKAFSDADYSCGLFHLSKSR